MCSAKPPKTSNTEETPYRPTPLSPHKWCPQLHGLSALAAAFAILYLLVENPLSVLVFGAFVALYFILTKLLYRKSTTQLIKEDEAIRKDTTAKPLQVNKGWARTAVITDIVFSANATFLAILMWSGQYESTNQGTGGYTWTSVSSSTLAVLIAIASVALYLISHKKATSPAREDAE